MEKFLKSTSERSYKFTRNWFDPHIPKWEETLGVLKTTDKINVLEVGVFEGKSTVWILDELFHNPESKLIAIDAFENTFENILPTNDNEATFRGNIKKSEKESRVEIIKSNYFDALNKLNYEKRIKFDFIHVDGSHRACDVLANTVLSWNLLKKDGIMILDDYEWDYFDEPYNNPRIAIDSFLNSYESQIKIIYKRFQVAVKKVVKETTS